MPARRRSRIPLLLILVFVLMGLPSLVEFYTDWLWFGELGYQHVFGRILSTQTGLAIGGFLLAFAFAAGNLLIALRTLTRREILLGTPDGPRVVVVEPAQLRSLALALAAVGSAALCFYAGSHWEEWLLYLNAVPFGKADPILGRDISFYLFSLPLLQIARGFLMMILMGTVVGVTLVYLSAGVLGISGMRGLFINPPAVAHLSALAGGLFLLLAMGAWLEVPSLLLGDAGILHGASFTDVYARIPALRLLAAAGLLGALLAVYQVLQRRLWPIAIALALYLLVSIGGAVYAAAVQRFVVAPNEQVKETPFIVYNVAATRDAFALDRVDEREISGDATLTRADIDRNALTLRNVPLWDHPPLLQTFAQIQEIRTYYDFASVDNDRYRINGEYRQIMLSARELNSDSLPNKTWINEHLTFTHGYGLTLGPVNQVTPEGLPVLFIKNLPPESNVDLKVDEASLYYGELASDHVFVKTRTKEFHYPKGDDNVMSTYTGNGGVNVGSFFRKLLFSMRFRSLKTLLSNDLTEDSRIMFHRRIDERVERIAPFLTYDPDPYLAIDQGRLFWIQDAYTTSGRYPYATPGGTRRGNGLNYIRNSIKVVIDAYHGTTTFYRIDEQDPVAATIDKAFPGLLRPFRDMPEGLRTRLRYPQMIFAIQADMFSTYHMNNPAVFYNKEDQWEVSSIGAGNQVHRMDPYYSIMRLPGETQEEFIQMLPFTPRQKDNLAAWMVARSDGANYGRLMVFQFPKQKVVFGPTQVIARISQDQNISPQITLWNQQGSEVIQGTLLVIPIEEAVMYVRALYLRASGGRIPELKRVIAVYQNQIVMAETLEAAIDRIFPRPGQRPPADTTTGAPETTAADTTAVEPGTATSAATDLATLAAQAQSHYDQAIKAQRAGDWAKYGDELKKLGAVLEQMKQRK